jgi:hypothetical protein
MFANFLTFQLVLMLLAYRASVWVRASEIVAEENVIDRVEIDFRSLLTNHNTQSQQIYLYKLESDLTRFDIKMSRLYSSQLDEKSMRSFFRIENNTQVLLAHELTREKLCLSLKSCGGVDKTFQSDFKCVLSMNLILYLSPSVRHQQNKHFNSIKIVKINLIVSNLSDDYLQFEKQTYEFTMNATTSLLGSVSAFSLKNNDLNGLIKYYIVSNSLTNNAFQIDETTGVITANNVTLQAQSKFEFFVDAFMQCSFLRPLKNRTLVRVDLMSQNRNQPKLIVTNLIESKQLTTSSIECLKLSKNDFSNNVSIALAQLQLEDNNIIESSMLSTVIRPNRLGMLQVYVKNLVDNIYVVYLTLDERFVEYHQMFLTDLFELSVSLASSKFAIERKIHLCVNTVNVQENLHEELSLVQFEKSVYTLETDKSLEVNVLNMNTVNSIRFSIDNNNDNFKLDVQPGVNSSSFRLKIRSSKRENALHAPEILQYSMKGIAFNDMNESKNLAEIYNDLNRVALNNGKFLGFSCKILFNTERETFVNDSSSYVSNFQDVYVEKFLVKLDALVNNSIVGYLPNIYALSNSTNNVTDLSYALVNSPNPCFSLNKYTGVLKFIEMSNNLTELNCYNKEIYPLKLDVSLVSNNRMIRHSQIWVHDVSLKSNEKDTSHRYKKFYETNTNSVNIIYESSNTSELNQINKRTSSIDMFNLNFKFNFNFGKSQPNLVRLANMVSNFRSEQEFQTKFELLNKVENLFLMDSKKASLYLNLEKLSFANKRTKCAKLNFVAKNFVYSNSITRHLKSMDRFNLNLCLINGEPGQSLKETKLDNLNITYSSFLTPILVNDGEANFDYLVENSLMKPNLFYSFLYVSLSFSALSAFLILLLAYMCQKKRVTNNKTNSSSHPSQDTQRFYQNFQSNSFSSTSTSSDITSELKIRNDLSKTSLQKAIEANNHPLVPSLYQHVNASIKKEDARVPSCRRTIKSLCDSFDTSSTRVENEEQGVYCIATGMSFNLTSSNISSVTNSQFVDDNYQMNIGSPVSSSSSSNVNYISSPRFQHNNCTKLSLFDLTPNPQRLINKMPAFKLEENRVVIETSDKIEIDENMKQWIFVNYNFNCNSDLVNEKSRPTLLDASCAMSNVIESHCSNECII